MEIFVMNKVKKLAVTAMLFAVGMVLPFFIGQIPAIGKMLLPMHIPVLLCGFIVGWQYGALIGFLLPIVRGLVFGMPPLYPNAIAMAFEMAAYGFVSGYLYCYACRKACMGISGGYPAWNRRKCVHMEDVRRRCIPQRHTGNYSAAYTYSAYYGCT